MNKIIYSLILLTLLFGVISALAQDSDLPSSGILPDSPFYFLKVWKEAIQNFFTFGAESKAKQFLHLSEVRLAEYQKMIEKGTLRQAQGKKLEIAQKTLEKYEKQLGRALEKAEEAKDRGKDVGKLKEEISERILKHQVVFEGILEKVPEEAKSGIKKAIEASQKGFEKAIEAVSGEKKEELEKRAEEVKERLERKLGVVPIKPDVCIQVITLALSPDGVCKEFPTPCDVPVGWKEIDKCPQPSVAPLPTPTPTPTPIPPPAPTPTPTPQCKPVEPALKDYKCPGGTLLKWQCTCSMSEDGEEGWNCNVNPPGSCPAGVAPLTISNLWVRYMLWILKEPTAIVHHFWKTNVPANSYIEYGPTTSYGFTTGFTASPASPTTDHGTNGLPGAQQNATYHFRIVAEDTKGNKVVSDDYTFTIGVMSP